MDVESAFDTDIPVAPITSIEGIDACLREVDLFTRPDEHQRAINMLRNARFGESGGELAVGVKKLLNITEMARQDPDPAAKLVSSLIRESN